MLKLELLNELLADIRNYQSELANMQLNCPFERIYKESKCDELYDLESADGRYVKSVCYVKNPTKAPGAYSQCASAGMSPYIPDERLQEDLKKKLPNVPKAWVNGMQLFGPAASLVATLNGGFVLIPDVKPANKVEFSGYVYMANYLNDIVMIDSNSLEKMPYLCEFINGRIYYDS
jgi:hypothetical protein